MFGRVSRQEWLAMFFRPRFGKKKVAKLPKLPGLEPELDTFEVNLYDETSKRYNKYRLQARTKSEARAVLKKQLNGKIPQGTQLVKL